VRLLLPLLVLTACRRDDPAPTGSTLAPVVCDWGEVSAEPAPLDVHAARVTVTADAAGWITAGPRTGQWVEAGQTVAFIARDVAPTDDLEVALDGAPCPTGLTLDDPPTPWVHTTGDAPGLWCLDVSRSENGSSTDRFVCYTAEGRPVTALMFPDYAKMDVPSWTDDGRFVAIRSRRAAAVYDALEEPIAEVRAEDLATAYVHDDLDRHELMVFDEGPWAGAIGLVSDTTDAVGDRVIATNGAIVWSPEEGVLWDVTLHGELGDGEPLDPRVPYDRELLGPALDLDWGHANALLYDPDRHWLWMNLRAQDWAVALDPATDTVATRLGHQGDLALVDPTGAPLPDDQWFFHSHAPTTTPDGRWLVYDNGNVRAGQVEGDAPYSRIIELDVDPEAGQATLHWASTDGDPTDPLAFYAESQGNAIAVSDGIAWHHYATGVGPRVRWVSRDHSVRFTLDVEGASPAYRVTWREGLPGDR